MKQELNISEIRIGNYFEFEGKIMPVCALDVRVTIGGGLQIDQSRIQLYNGYGIGDSNISDAKISEIKPIKILVEHLQNSNLKLAKNRTALFYMQDFVCEFHSRYCFVDFHKGGYSTSRKIKYVHELQNLYCDRFGDIRLLGLNLGT